MQKALQATAAAATASAASSSKGKLGAGGPGAGGIGGGSGNTRGEGRGAGAGRKDGRGTKRGREEVGFLFFYSFLCFSYEGTYGFAHALLSFLAFFSLPLSHASWVRETNVEL